MKRVSWTGFICRLVSLWNNRQRNGPCRPFFNPSFVVQWKKKSFFFFLFLLGFSSLNKIKKFYFSALTGHVDDVTLTHRSVDDEYGSCFMSYELIYTFLGYRLLKQHPVPFAVALQLSDVYETGDVFTVCHECISHLTPLQIAEKCREGQE